MKKELIIIGGGTAGYVGAIRGAQLGAKVTLIEKADIGGTCLNRGCIPTKALLKNAEILNTLSHIDDFGISVSDYTIDFAKIMARKDQVVNQLVRGVEQLLRDYGVEVIQGEASFVSSSKLRVKTSQGEIDLESEQIVIATGSVPTRPEIPGIDLDKVITSDELLELKELPKSLAIAGSGVIGIEFASIFNAMGTEVTVISSTLLKRIDTEIQKRLSPILKRQGLTILKDTRVKAVAKAKDGLSITVFDKKKEKETILEAEYLLMATGRRPYYDNLALEKAGVAYTSKGITVNERFETNVPGILAVGDAIGGLMLAHVASHEAIDAVEGLLGHSPSTNFDVVPDCVFIEPEIAYVGMTEEMAVEKGIPFTSSKFLFAANGKSLSMGNTDGFIKVVAHEETKKILGVHIMGPHASDIVHEAALAINNDLDVKAIAHTIHAHPTLSEAFMEAVNGITETSIHMSPKKKK
ncbi:MAG: pyridine nucleotide-disulfide oxidoreductase [delta proteobacterium ML8_F1]|nr:MAG: pyridine nucleotide-disulfide oxidoreductase [delta proteobacterium ML8_F1]